MVHDCRVGSLHLSMSAGGASRLIVPAHLLGRADYRVQ